MYSTQALIPIVAPVPAISARQHGIERGFILDGVAPLGPSVGSEVSPSLLGVASTVGRLERFRGLGLITASEFSAERLALEGGLRGGVSAVERGGAARGALSEGTGPLSGVEDRPPLPGLSGSGGSLDGAGEGSGLVSASGGEGDLASRAGIAVHLASFKSREQAESGWSELQESFPALSEFRALITAITLPGKGVFYRLNAGPLPTRGAARSLCERLADRFCEPVFVGG